jgi:hypothetical protein
MTSIQGRLSWMCWDAFNTAAYECGSYDELLQLAMRTVRVS